MFPRFGADQCTPDPFRELTDPYVLYIYSHYIYRSKQTAKNITNEILAVKGQRIAVFWNFVVTVAFFNSHFIVVALSHPAECFWYFGIRWLTHNCLWSRDLSDDAPILEALHHCKATPDERIRTKCSIFKIPKEQFICWYVENEFWGQKCGYETDDLKNNLQLEVFDRESKPSGYIWSRLNWIHISFFPTAVGGIDFKRCVTDCVYIRREAQSQR